MESITTTAPRRGRGRPKLYANQQEAAAARAGRLAARREHEAIKKRIKAADAASHALPVVEVLLLTVKQAAEALAISESTIAKLISDGHLNSIKIGGSRRIELAELKKFASTGTRN